MTTTPGLPRRGRGTRFRTLAFALGGALMATIGNAASAEDAAAQECPAAGNPQSERGWTAYRANDMAAARTAFESALRVCPRHQGARTGLGYVALRQDRTDEARRLFDAVVADAPRNVDALVGLGIAAWRAQDQEAARSAFTRAQQIDPGNAEARDFLARLGAAPAAGPTTRPPLVLPNELTYPARTSGDHFEVRTARGWEPFYIKGVNLGAALPGKHPSEFPDSATYVRWIEQMAGMGTNAVRVYTIHPPHFYGALYDWNRRNPQNPLWIIHGVWAELPPEDDFANPQWEGEFFREMRHVVDLLHGRADIPLRPGHAGGAYTADVSPWVLAYIIGREWEPYSAANFNARRPRETTWNGRYLTVRGGTPMDAWLG
ncbi:MAG TPA: tetratricopeptide repeat protein, partial [Longimicrobium sp.]|nr:tetratricopeptide repeat protein [Longimicrobium sp.]